MVTRPPHFLRDIPYHLYVRRNSPFLVGMLHGKARWGKRYLLNPLDRNDASRLFRRVELTGGGNRSLA